jgi:dihydrofolate reductase
MLISLIVAAAENNVIGKDNQLIWRLPADMAFFKQKTTGHTIIMGRKTHESMGRPLPNRTNIIISRNKEFTAPGCQVVSSLEEALQKAAAIAEEEAYIIGGAEIYRQALKMADKIYLTRVHASFEGDTFFPEITPDEWTMLSRTDHAPDAKNIYRANEKKVTPKEGIRIKSKSYLHVHEEVHPIIDRIFFADDAGIFGFLPQK